MVTKSGVFDVILVEDDANDAEFVIRNLSKFVCTEKILHIRDGAEFLEYLFAMGKYAQRDLQCIPKVLLLDLKLPKVSGIEVLQTMKDNNHSKTIPVVVFSSSGEEEDIQMCYYLGASSYVVKPVDFGKYVETLDRLGTYWLQVNTPPG